MTRACPSAFSHAQSSEKVSFRVRRANSGAGHVFDPAGAPSERREAAVTLELTLNASGFIFTVLAVLVMLLCDC